MNAGGACRAPLQTGQPPAERGGRRPAQPVRQQGGFYGSYLSNGNRRIPLSGYHRLGRSGPGGQAVCRYPRGILQQFRRVCRPHVREELCGGKGRRASGGCLLLHLCPNRELRRQGAGGADGSSGGQEAGISGICRYGGRGHRRTGPDEGDAACALRTGKTACGGVVSGPVHLFQFCEKPAGYGEAQRLSVFCGGLHGQRYLSGRLPDVAVFQHRACTGHIGQCGPGPLVCGFSAGHSGGRLQWL